MRWGRWNSHPPHSVARCSACSTPVALWWVPCTPTATHSATPSNARSRWSSQTPATGPAPGAACGPFRRGSRHRLRKPYATASWRPDRCLTPPRAGWHTKPGAVITECDIRAAGNGTRSPNICLSIEMSATWHARSDDPSMRGHEPPHGCVACAGGCARLAADAPYVPGSPGPVAVREQCDGLIGRAESPVFRAVRLPVRRVRHGW